MKSLYKDIKKLNYLICTLLLILSILPLKAHAQANPDQLQIVSKQVFRSLAVTGDMLFIIEYNIEYTTPPSQSADQLFIIRLRDGTDDLASIRPYPFRDEGYGKGVVSFYFTPDTAPTWLAALSIRIQGDPIKFVSPPTVDFSVDASDYKDAATATQRKQLITNYVLQTVVDLSAGWGIQLVQQASNNYVLNADGQLYYNIVIPGLIGLAPTLFSTSTITPSFTDKEFTYTYQDELQGRFDDTFIQDGLEGMSTYLNISVGMVGTVLSLIFIFALIGLSRNLTDNVYVGGAFATTGLVFSSLMGLFSLTPLFIIYLFIVLATGYVVFYRTS